MKKFFTLVFLTLTISISRAADNEGCITVTNLGFYDVQVEIDGKHYDDGNRNITIRHLSAAGHYLKIFRVDKEEKILYADSITIKPQYDIDIVINRFEKVMIDELSVNDQHYRKDGYDRYDNRWSYHDSYYGEGIYPLLSRGAFYTLQDMMQQEISGTGRLKLVKQVIDKNYFTAMQVKELVSQFTSTDRALELAKYAYPKTINKNEFFIVYAAFTRRSAWDELEQFIKNYKE
jgi:hypothetical protein